ncbi:MAG: HAMP domain-containing sensor histidine kinase [Bacteroidales bacterium]
MINFLTYTIYLTDNDLVKYSTVNTGLINFIMNILLICFGILIIGLIISIINNYISNKKVIYESELFNKIIETMPVPIFISKGHHLIIYNKAIMDILGLFLRTKEANSEIDPIAKEYDYSKMVSKTEKDGQHRQMISNTVLSIGYHSHHIIHSYPINYLGKKSVIVIFKDIKPYLDAITQAKKSNYEVNVFFGNMSHELRTPLNSILGFSNMLSVETNKSYRLKYIQKINNSSQELYTITREILVLSQLETGTYLKEKEKCDLIELSKKVVESFKTYSNYKKNIELVVNLPHDKLYAIVYKELFCLKLENTLSNAYKFTKSGTIELGVLFYENKIIAYVKDTGIGIEPKDQIKIFERFEKISTFSKGYGLGMYLNIAIKNLSHGKIGVYSVLGEGSLFWTDLSSYEKTPYNDSYDEDRIKALLNTRWDGLWYEIDEFSHRKEYKGPKLKSALKELYHE